MCLFLVCVTIQESNKLESTCSLYIKKTSSTCYAQIHDYLTAWYQKRLHCFSPTQLFVFA
jgi:hypothetical protein